MIITKKHLDRRTFLRGVGVTLGLPLLDAMVPALTAQSRTAASGIRRLGVVYVPNGIDMARWTPAAAGAGFELSPILTPLAPFRDRLLVLSGLCHETGKALPGEGAGDHARATPSFLTGAHPKKTQGPDLRAGVSVDQMAAGELSKETPLTSLELGLETIDVVGGCDLDYSCVYTNTLAWRTPTTPLPAENNPRAVFERLFGDSHSTDPGVREARLQRKRSILDFIAGDIRDFEKGLGPRDLNKLAQYLDAVRDLERGIQQVEAQGAKELPLVERPSAIPATFAEHAKLMYDLQWLAYQADLTRVITFLIGPEVSGRSYPEIGVPDSHHGLSHHQNDPARLAKIAKINTFHMQMFANYLEKLRATSEGDGTMLDHTMLLYGSGLSDSNVHSHDNLPVIVAGGAGRTAGGRHVKYPKGTPMANLLLTMLNRIGVREGTFGDSNGQLQELFAL